MILVLSTIGAITGEVPEGTRYNNFFDNFKLIGELQQVTEVERPF
jgi:hypothetical protein